ncbi:MAG TPA: GIY-YIG nuclease family protein [Candidatus Andersenbacteria bacterium]|nr:GIY-YIG nuclease family protein [Candidatus Andersenbacteria bacterium]
MAWHVYIARARTGRYYTGISPHPEQRIDDHNNDRGAKFAHDQGPFTLVYISPPFPDQKAARKREHQIKGWTRSKKEKLIKGDWM